MVASVGVITAGRGYDYLTKEVATSKHDYYTGSGEAPGQRAGRAAALLGLSGEVDADDMAVLYGRFVVPATVGGTRLSSGRWEREQVLGRAVSTRVRADGSVLEPMAALDVTFSPSKSVSLLWALSSNPQVRDSVVDAHEAAVATALEYLDAHASHTRTGAGGVRPTQLRALSVLGDIDHVRQLWLPIGNDLGLDEITGTAASPRSRPGYTDLRQSAVGSGRAKGLFTGCRGVRWQRRGRRDRRGGRTGVSHR